MKQPVVIKANNFGIMVRLDPELEFEELLKAVGEKFKESANFFGSAEMAIAFNERKLSDEEEDRIIQAILDNSSVKIICTIDYNEEIEDKFKKRLDRLANENDISNAKIYRGFLRSGQVLESETSAIVVGDINPGAKVSAKGNVIVFGALKGEAAAGTGGNEDAFVIALDMNPIQLRIGGVMGRASDGNRILPIKRNNKVAFVKDGAICIEDLHKSDLDWLKI